MGAAESEVDSVVEDREVKPVDGLGHDDEIDGAALRQVAFDVRGGDGGGEVVVVDVGEFGCEGELFLARVGCYYIVEDPCKLTLQIKIQLDESFDCIRLIDTKSRIKSGTAYWDRSLAVSGADVPSEVVILSLRGDEFEQFRRICWTCLCILICLLLE